MPRIAYKRILVIDQSNLAKNMYHLLFDGLDRFNFEYSETLDTIEKERKKGIDLLVINSNIFEESFPDLKIPTILLWSQKRLDLKEKYGDHPNITFIPKPFFPYVLITELNKISPRPKRETKKKKGRKKRF